MNKKIANYIKLLVSSLIPIFIGPILIHFGRIKETYTLTILGVIVCICAVVMIFMSLFGIITELFKK
tara:strand:- start:1143 stop:1343 length:201 start_codon:yes stop_codon:yes gene_type:complete